MARPSSNRRTSSPRHRSPPKIVFVEEPLDTAEFTCPPTPLSCVPKPVPNAPAEPALPQPATKEKPSVGACGRLSASTLIVPPALVGITLVALSFAL